MKAEDFKHGAQLKRWLRSKGIVGPIVARKDGPRRGTWMRQSYDREGRRWWYWWIGVERSQYEYVEALLPDGNDFAVCRRKTAEEEQRSC